MEVPFWAGVAMTQGYLWAYEDVDALDFRKRVEHLFEDDLACRWLEKCGAYQGSL